MTVHMMTEASAVPQGLAAIREARGLTQEQLAVRACLGSATVFRIEHGQHKPRRSTLRLLADALDCDPSDLLPTTSESPGAGGRTEALAKSDVVASRDACSG